MRRPVSVFHMNGEDVNCPRGWWSVTQVICLYACSNANERRNRRFRVRKSNWFYLEIFPNRYLIEANWESKSLRGKFSKPKLAPPTDPEMLFINLVRTKKKSTILLKMRDFVTKCWPPGNWRKVALCFCCLPTLCLVACRLAFKTLGYKISIYDSLLLPQLLWLCTLRAPRAWANINSVQSIRSNISWGEMTRLIEAENSSNLRLLESQQ